MIRVVLFDLGLTLVDAEERPFPHVEEALTTIQSFTAPAGRRLSTGLVSDFDMPAPPAKPASVRAIFDRYLAILDRTGLRDFFEPVRRRVTLSTHAGVMKPARQVFLTALARLRVQASLEECAFITENLQHIQAVRAFGMSALHFHRPASSATEFDEWRQAPALVARLVDGPAGPNVESAVRRYLDATHAFDVETISPPKRGRTLAVRGTLWKPVGAAGGKSLASVHVPFEVEGEVTLDDSGSVRSIHLDEPSPDEVGEAATLVKSLAKHGQLVESSDTPRTGPATHAIETDDQGRRRLVRKRVVRAW